MTETTPKTVIRASTVKEEFSQLKNVLRKKDFYEKNGYKVAYPDNPLLLDAKILQNQDLMFETFKNAEYDENYYKEGLRVLNPYKDQIEKLILKLKDLGKNWSFKMFPEYQIVLTRYGPGGSYHYDTGTVVMLATKDGKFKRSDPIQTIVHEIVHMGIEESIVIKYKLSHWEKERLVDLLVSTIFKEEMPNYRMQDTEFANLEHYINADTVLELPKAIEKYLAEKQ